MPKKNRKARIEISKENFVSSNEQENTLGKDNKNKKKKKGHKVLKVILIFFLIVVILGIAIFSAYLFKSKGNVKEAALSIATDFVGEQDPIFILLLGVSEDISAALTDTIMLAGYNPQTQNAFVVSIPRDTYVGKNQKYANGYDKINAKYQSGYESTITAVEELTGVSIDYYVLIKNTALVDVVDSIGGVEFDVPINMNYDDITQDLHIHLKSGLQTLNGDQAEQLVRFRHNNDGSSYPSSYGDNDYGRMRTQREFIKTLAKQLISLDNVPKVKSIATAVFDNLETNITLSKALGYVPFGLKLDIENNLTMIQLPGQSDLVNELWFYVPDYEKISELFDELIEKMNLEEEFEKSHYKKINKSNIKIEKTNKKDTNEKKEVIEKVETEKNRVENTIKKESDFNKDTTNIQTTNNKVEKNESVTEVIEESEKSDSNDVNSTINSTITNENVQNTNISIPSTVVTKPNTEKTEDVVEKPVEKEPAEKESAEKEPEKKEPAKAEPVEKEPTEKETVKKEPAEKESEKKEANEKEQVNEQKTETVEKTEVTNS
ncbi:MAG: LCP family protein [Clostridia bacterium]|nr:LCP family protein [Clostridia bacterium]